MQSSPTKTKRTGQQLFAAAVLTGLFWAQAWTVLTRGAYFRIYWIPAAVLITLLMAAFLLGLNHGWLSARLNRRTDWLFLGFLGWAALSLVHTVNREESLFEVMRLLTLGMVYFLVAYAVPEPPWKRALALLMLGIGFLDAAYGLVEFFSGKSLLQLSWLELWPSRNRVLGTFHNHNHFAGLMEMATFLGLGLILASRSRNQLATEQTAKRLFFVIPCGLMILALILSLSRGGWISFLVGLFFFLFLVWWHSHPSWSRVLAMVLLVMIVIGVFLYRANRQPLQRRVESLVTYYQTSEDLSMDTRFSIWKSAVAMIEDHPWTGTGWGTFRSVYPSYRRDRIFRGIVFAHNDYLQIAAGMGLPGLGLFLLFLAMIFREGIRVIRSRASDFLALAMPGLLAGLFSLLVHGWADFNLMIPSNAMFFFSLAGIVASRGREAP